MDLPGKVSSFNRLHLYIVSLQPGVSYTHGTMKLAGFCAMCSSKAYSLGKYRCAKEHVCLKKQNCSKIGGSGMELEFDWAKHRRSLVLKSEAICSATSSIGWFCKRISLSEGFSEFL